MWFVGGGACQKIAFEGVAAQKNQRKRGVQAKYSEIKSAKIAGVTYFGGGGVIPKKLFLRGIMWLKLVSWGDQYHLQMTLPQIPPGPHPIKNERFQLLYYMPLAGLVPILKACLFSCFRLSSTRRREGGFPNIKGDYEEFVARAVYKISIEFHIALWVKCIYTYMYNSQVHMKHQGSTMGTQANTSVTTTIFHDFFFSTVVIRRLKQWKIFSHSGKVCCLTKSLLINETVTFCI